MSGLKESKANGVTKYKKTEGEDLKAVNGDVIPTIVCHTLQLIFCCFECSDLCLSIKFLETLGIGV
jgi:hypothetical protein